MMKPKPLKQGSKEYYQKYCENKEQKEGQK
jgi:hypothetical protein